MTYMVVPFEPKIWRRYEKSRPTEQGIVVGCESRGNETLALVDSGDIHCMMIGAAGVGKTALVPHKPQDTLAFPRQIDSTISEKLPEFLITK